MNQCINTLIVTLVLVNKIVSSEDSYQYSDSDQVVKLVRQKRQFRLDLGSILGGLANQGQQNNNNNNNQNKDPLGSLINQGIQLVATNPDVQQGILNAAGVNIQVPKPNRPNQVTTTTQGPNLGERCGNQICSNTQTCCRTCDQFGDPTVPNGCATRCPQVFCQPVQSTTKRPNSGGGIDNGQTGGNLQECFERKTEYIGSDLNIANNGQRNKKRNRRSCEQSCRQTPGCNYWVYVSRKERDTRIAGACYLKENKVSVRTNVKKRTSGPRNCNGNSNGGNGSSNGGGNGDLVACRTTGGGTTGALCVIPFIYKGKKYNGCTLQDDHQGKPWCSVRVDGDGKHIGGQGLWGHCNSKCKTDANGVDIENTTQRPSSVDCQWSEWSAWERCSKTCGSGQRKARRTIRQQAQNGGRSCQGSSTKSETCKTNACPSAPSQTCGNNARRFQTKIVGGRPADPDEWPWLAALIRPSTKTSGQYCGAALIGDEWVLTAAHCVAPFTKDKIKVTLGEYSFDQEGETSVQKKIGVRDLKMHENYDDKSFENDIALIRLDRKVQFTKSVYPICLPPKDKDYTDTRAFVIGWGTIYFGGPTSSVLQEVNVRVWDNKQCATNYGRLNRKITDTMMCAGERGRDACQGDSGGPLNCLNFQTGKWELCGVVSWGARCAEPDFPGVYTRVTDYLDWIDSAKNQL